jgi:hypothetical protein
LFDGIMTMNKIYADAIKAARRTCCRSAFMASAIDPNVWTGCISQERLCVGCGSR